MGKRVPSKRRLSASPSPTKSDPATRSSRLPTVPPRKKKGKRESSKDDEVDDGSGNNLQGLALPGQGLQAQVGEELRAPDSSSQSMPFPGLGVMAPPTTDSGTTAAAPFTAPEQSHQTTSNLALPGPTSATSRVTQSMASENQPSATQDPEVAAMEDFVFDEAFFATLNFPPEIFTDAQAAQIDPQATTAAASEYPEIMSTMQTGFYAPQEQEQAPAPSTEAPNFAPDLQPAYPLPGAIWPAPPLPQGPAAPALPSNFTGLHTPQYPPPPPFRQTPITLQATYPLPFLAPQAPTPAPAVFNPTIPLDPNIPQDPDTLNEPQLWAQLRYSRLMMAGTLETLVARNRLGALGRAVNDRVFDVVTATLIRMLMLWHTLRLQRRPT